MPTEPVSNMRMASVRVPARSVEKARFPFPVLKFWVRMLVRAAVVVPFVSIPPEGVVEPASVLKERREAVEVAEARFERNSWSWVAPEEVLTISNFVWGEEVPIPTLPSEEMKMEEVAWATPSSEPTMKYPLVSGSVTTAPEAPRMAGLFEMERRPVAVREEVAAEESAAVPLP